ncbi:MAG: hypothetical protein OES25_16800, partial [Acidobacteriota bacterium]|nr:hypothetical protein [Acidobacteriota bacterium]
RNTGAWLGDVAASDALAAWEVLRFNRHHGKDPTFEKNWTTLRDLLYMPSYARVLVPRTPGVDVKRNKIGWWRIVLPRTAWIGERKKGRAHAAGFDDLPSDLIPDQPWAYRVASIMRTNAEFLGTTFASCDLGRVSYLPTARPRHLEPGRVFREVDVTTEFVCEARRHLVTVSLKRVDGQMTLTGPRGLVSGRVQWWNDKLRSGS